jgi:shikimate dehydrogenase
MHEAAYRTLGIAASYVHLRVAPGAFPTVTEMLERSELDGVNVTMPHKAAAFEAVDERSDLVHRTGAVNTIVVDRGRLVGHNTDVAGVRHAMDSLNLDDELPVTILGSGGAASAAAVALDGRRIRICARDPDAAAGLARRAAIAADIVPWGYIPTGTILVNATPIGMKGETLPTGVIEGAVGIIDMAYGPSVTPTVAAASRAGTPFADGITMLVGQAGAAFRLFVGLEAPMDIMETAARST